MRKTLIFFGVTIMTMCMMAKSIAGDATLSWNPPTTNDNGTPLTNLAGYKIYYGTTSGVYDVIVDVGNVTTYTVTGLGVGTHYFAATAYNVTRNESRYSNEVSKTISSSSPAVITLTASGSGGTVTASWNAVAAATGGYQLTFQSDVSTGYTGVIGLVGTTDTVNGLKPATYSVSVKGYDTAGNIVGSSSVTTITLTGDATPPNDVTNFVAVFSGTGIHLSWTNPTNTDFAGLVLEYSTTSNTGPWTLLANLGGVGSGFLGAQQTYDHKYLSAGTYYYRIHTKDTSGNITSTEYADAAVPPQNDAGSIAETPAITQTPPADAVTTARPQQEERKKESGGWSFGCGTVSGPKPPTGGGTDASALALAAVLIFFAFRRKIITATE